MAVIGICVWRAPHPLGTRPLREPAGTAPPLPCGRWGPGPALGASIRGTGWRRQAETPTPGPGSRADCEAIRPRPTRCGSRWRMVKAHILHRKVGDEGEILDAIDREATRHLPVHLTPPFTRVGS
jgi:hypothetical protein